VVVFVNKPIPVLRNPPKEFCGKSPSKIKFGELGVVSLVASKTQKPSEKLSY